MGQHEIWGVISWVASVLPWAEGEWRLWAKGLYISQWLSVINCLLHTLLAQLNTIQTLPSSISTISITVIYSIHVHGVPWNIRAYGKRYTCSECIMYVINIYTYSQMRLHTVSLSNAHLNKDDRNKFREKLGPSDLSSQIYSWLKYAVSIIILMFMSVKNRTVKGMIMQICLCLVLCHF